MLHYAADNAKATAMTIAKIERVPLRDVWKHEAHDFTKWLEENIDVLSDAIDRDIGNVEREKKTESVFSVDLVAEDNDGSSIIVENQLGKSDHDHLGKLITYLTAMQAKVAVWIVADPRPEHVAALNWLNESASADFYLLKIEAIRIEESPPAPLAHSDRRSFRRGQVDWAQQARDERAASHALQVVVTVGPAPGCNASPAHQSKALLVDGA